MPMVSGDLLKLQRMSSLRGRTTACLGGVAILAMTLLVLGIPAAIGGPVLDIPTLSESRPGITVGGIGALKAMLDIRAPTQAEIGDPAPQAETGESLQDVLRSMLTVRGGRQ